jgi:hypothetical protein
MSSAVRVLRFARVPDILPAAPRGQELVAHVLLDEQHVGQIVQQFQAWHYQLIDGTPSGLVSTLSRQDIEAQIALHYFGPETGLENSVPRLPLAM